MRLLPRLGPGHLYQACGVVPHVTPPLRNPLPHKAGKEGTLICLSRRYASRRSLRERANGPGQESSARLRLRNLYARSALFILTSIPLLACNPQVPTRAEYLQMVREAVRFAEQDARDAASRGSGTGPLLIDVRSFRNGSHRATGEVMEPGVVETALDQPFQAVVPDSSFACMQMPVGYSCWVPDNGVYLHLNIASRASGRVTLHVASTVTASNFIPPVLCERVSRLRFEKREVDWVLAATEPIRTC